MDVSKINEIKVGDLLWVYDSYDREAEKHVFRVESIERDPANISDDNPLGISFYGEDWSDCSNEGVGAVQAPEVVGTLLFEDPSKLNSFLREQYLINDVEFLSSFFDFNVKMTPEDIVAVYVALKEEIDEDEFEYPDSWEGSDVIYEGNAMELLDKLSEDPRFIRYAEGEEISFT